MRRCLALLPLLAACDAWSDPPKDATWSDDSSVSEDCRAGTSAVDSSGVVFTDLVLDGLPVIPSVDGLCASTDGLSIALSFSTDDEAGSFYLEVSDYAGYGPTENGVESLAMAYGDVSWAQSDFYAGSITVTDGDDGVEGVVQLEATNPDSVNVAFSLSWTLSSSSP